MVLGKTLFPVEKFRFFSYFFHEKYVVMLIGSVSLRHFESVPTRYVNV